MMSLQATFKQVMEGAQRCALIGSRKPPKRISEAAVKIGRYLSDRGLHAYSGGADGMDSQFMFDYSPDRRTIILPEDGFNDLRDNDSDILDYTRFDHVKAAEEAMKVCGNFEFQSDYVKRRYSRNAMQVLGMSLESPVDFVLFWAEEKESCVQGGTAVAYRLARLYSVPTFNLWRENTLKEVCDYFNISSRPPTLDFLYD